MAREFTLGQMVANTMVSGTTTKCTVLEFSHGMMVENMRANTLMTKSKDREFLLGQMVVSTKVSGKTVSSTA